MTKHTYEFNCFLEIDDDTYLYLKDLQKFIYTDKTYSEILGIITNEKWIELKKKYDEKNKEWDPMEYFEESFNGRIE